MNENKSEEIGILKSIWRKSNAGIWTVHDIKGIDLKPRNGFERDYFKIDNDIVLLTEQPGDNLFASFGTTEFLLRQSIVPIVAWNDGDDEIQSIGTGFFISASGYLMTAAHVVRDPIDRNYANLTEINKNEHKLNDTLRFGVLLPVNPAMRTAPFIDVPLAVREANWLMCPFEWITHWGNDVDNPLIHQRPEFKLHLDVAICKVREYDLIGPYQPLNIGSHRLATGHSAVAIGYAEMKNIQIKNSKNQPELVVSVGTVTDVYNDNITEKYNPTPGPNFEFDAKIPGKMSGAPILVGGGILTKGIVSRSWQNENHATGCLIAPILSLPIVDGKSLLDLQRSGNEGIIQVIGPDL